MQMALDMEQLPYQLRLVKAFPPLLLVCWDLSRGSSPPTSRFLGEDVTVRETVYEAGRDENGKDGKRSERDESL